MAAANHDRAAKFWDERGDLERAGIQREIADFERHGAALERRWARIVDPTGSPTTRRTSELIVGRTREGARALSERLSLAAEALEISADLAEVLAKRRQASGEEVSAEQERLSADNTREAARRARSEAEKWLKASQFSQ
jgi:hypothetical protein